MAIRVLENGGAGEVTDGGGDGFGLVVPIAGSSRADGNIGACSEVEINGQLMVRDRAVGNLGRGEARVGGVLGPAEVIPPPLEGLEEGNGVGGLDDGKGGAVSP